ncbi:MAG: ACT domain-containing protein [Tepidisphaeraceae bacterium]
MHAILTAIGTDRPGLVDEVSQFIFERGGNIEDSRMVNLRGQFAMVVLIGGSEEAIRKVEAKLDALAQNSRIRAEIQPAADAAAPLAARDAIPYRLTATAIDQQGLVHRIAHVLRELGVNIESLDTRLAAAPYTGAPVFEMELVVAVPRSAPLSKLRDQLGKLCDELNIDWQLEPA